MPLPGAYYVPDKRFTSISSFSPERFVFIIPTLQMRKWRHGEVKSIAKVIAGKWQSRVRSPNSQHITEGAGNSLEQE